MRFQSDQIAHREWSRGSLELTVGGQCIVLSQGTLTEVLRCCEDLFENLLGHLIVRFAHPSRSFPIDRTNAFAQQLNGVVVDTNVVHNVDIVKVFVHLSQTQ